MRFLIDVSLSPGWVPVFAASGIEAVHWATVGAASAPDQLIMKYAELHGFIIVTHDLDFSAMLFDTGAQRPSVVQIRSKDVNPVAIGARVLAEVLRAEQEIRSGAVLTLDLKRTRVRILPFKRLAL